VTANPSSSIWSGGEVNFIVRNRVDDMVLMHGICHVSKGERDGDFSTMILPKRSAFAKVKASLLPVGGIECCLVYELINQRNESESIMEFHQVFIAVRVFAIPLIKKYSASAAMFMTRKDQFISSRGDMKWMKEEMKRLKEMKRSKGDVKWLNEEMKRLKEDINRLKNGMNQLKNGILQEHLVNNTYSFICDIKGQTLRLKAEFHPGWQSSIEVILEETNGHVDNGPIPFK
jgi:hypothetical protein